MKVGVHFPKNPIIAILEGTFFRVKISCFLTQIFILGFPVLGGVFMITYNAKKSLIFAELGEEKQKEFFDLKTKSFMHNIDSLYFMIRINEDWKEHYGAVAFKSDLLAFQSASYEVEEFPCYEHLGSWVMKGVAFSKIYRYDLHQNDKFALFIAHTVPNANTPQIMVQLRSQYLWLEGEKQAVIKTLKDVETLLKEYDLTIQEVKENRIDYAYHTNYIQNPTTYFKHQNINKMQQSRFKRGTIEFYFKNEWDVETDYLTLGKKKSNNLFFRIYDKTNEVINLGYKQFFIEMWHQKKLINTYDKYCLEKAFLNPSAENHKYVDVARLEFYVEYGSNQEQIKNCLHLINAKNKNYPAIIKLANELTPAVTKILNVEFETKRKFYSTMDETINTALPVVSDVPKYSHKLFRIIDNKKLFCDYLTCNTSDGSGIIRFINYKAKNKNGDAWQHKRDFPVSDFWDRLQNVTLNWDAPNVELVRQYQKSVSLELMKKRATRAIGVLSLYQNGKVKENLYEDVTDFLAVLNENDLHNAIEYKEKRFRQLRERLTNIDVSLPKAHTFKIINEDGEILAEDTQEMHLDSNNDNTQQETIHDYADSFTIEGADDVLMSVYLDLLKQRDTMKKQLEKTHNYNQKFVLKQKIQKISLKLQKYLNI